MCISLIEVTNINSKSYHGVWSEEILDFFVKNDLIGEHVSFRILKVFTSISDLVEEANHRYILVCLPSHAPEYVPIINLQLPPKGTL